MTLKINVFVDKNEEERIDIFVRKKGKLVDDIEELIYSKNEILGYKNEETVKLRFPEISLFTVENEKTKAVTESGEFIIRERLYMIEEIMPDYFIRLNKSSLGNIRCFRKFDTSVSGTLKVTFRNGYTDYVSRRQLKAVKERLGL